MKEKEEKKIESQEQSQGLKIDKKTILGVTALLFVIMILAGILTQVMPAGEYERIDGSITAQSEYIELSKDEVGYKFWRVFTAPFEIFTTSDAMTGVAIMLFIVLIGGTFLILDKSGVLKYIMVTVVARFEKKKYVLLGVMVFVCMAMSSVVGILEESITLVPLAVAIALALGWDSLVGIGFSLIAIAFGYTAATFNPFNVGVVQSMAGLPMFSGLGYRLIVFLIIYVILASFLILYAKKIEKNPQKSIVYESDKDLRKKYVNNSDTSEILANTQLKKAVKIFVGCILCVFVIAGVSFAAQNFIENEDIRSLVSYSPMVAMALLFTIGGLKAGSVAGIKGKALASGFFDGVKAIAPCVPLIIFVMSITYILKQGMIIDTLLYYVYEFIKDFSPTQALLLIFLFVLVLEFFIGSGTAKAFLIMPLILPLAKMLGITDQSVVLAFCFGDGFSNILYPTSGVMLIAIGLVNVSYGKFLRFTWKLFLAVFAAAALLLILAIKIGYN